MHRNTPRRLPSAIIAATALTTTTNFHRKAGTRVFGLVTAAMLVLLTSLVLADSANAAPDQVLRTGKFVPLDPDVAPAGYLALQANSPSQLIVIRNRPVVQQQWEELLIPGSTARMYRNKKHGTCLRVPANADVFSFDSLVLGACDSDKRARWRIKPDGSASFVINDLTAQVITSVGCLWTDCGDTTPLVVPVQHIDSFGEKVDWRFDQV
jgi:hypothetical protein